MGATIYLSEEELILISDLCTNYTMLFEAADKLPDDIDDVHDLEEKIVSKIKKQNKLNDEDYKKAINLAKDKIKEE